MRVLVPILIAAAAFLPGPLAAQQGSQSVIGGKAMPAVVATPEEQPSLDELLWQARPLVVFADSANDPRFRQQIAELEEGAAGLEDRRVVILTDTDPAARGPLRQKLRPRDFGIVLIDTDGTVVQRRPSVTTAREIMNLIDRLPSRRQETGSRRP